MKLKEIRSNNREQFARNINGLSINIEESSETETGGKIFSCLFTEHTIGTKNQKDLPGLKKIEQNEQVAQGEQFETGRQYRGRFILQKGKTIDDLPDSFFINLFKKIKEHFIRATVILLSIVSLTSCVGNYENTTRTNNETIVFDILNSGFIDLKEIGSGQISFINSFSEFSDSIYNNRGIISKTMPEKFQHFIKDNKIELNDIVSYIKNGQNSKSASELYDVDFTIFQRGALYEAINSDIDSKNGNLGASIKKIFEKDYPNYTSYSESDILKRDIAVISDFSKSKLFNGNEDELNIIKEAFVEVVGGKGFKTVEGTTIDTIPEKTVTLEDIIKINNYILEHSDTEEMKLRGKYSTIITNNLIFLLTNSPKEYVDTLLSNDMKFEIGYGDKGYINILGYVLFSKKAKIQYDNQFKDTVSEINKYFISKKLSTEIILEGNSIMIYENGSTFSPGEFDSTDRFLRENPNSELRKIALNSTFLSSFFKKKYNLVEKTPDKEFFILGVQKIAKEFQSTYNVSNKEMDNLFKNGNILNENDKEITLYGKKISLSEKYSNKYIPDYYERLFINHPDFVTLIHEASHKEHLSMINENINDGGFDFMSQMALYPYSSNYNNDPIFKSIYKEIFYKAYKGNIRTEELDYFGYYALSTFNFMEFVAELNSAYLAYPKYNEYIQKEDPVNSKLFLDLQRTIHNNLKDN